MAKKRAPQSKKRNPLLKKIINIASKVFLYFLLVSVIWVVAYRFINPPLTLLMALRNIERKADGKSFKTEKKWVDFEDMSNNMKRAAVSAEDQLFLKHIGFDMKAIE